MPVKTGQKLEFIFSRDYARHSDTLSIGRSTGYRLAFRSLGDLPISRRRVSTPRSYVSRFILMSPVTKFRSGTRETTRRYWSWSEERLEKRGGSRGFLRVSSPGFLTIHAAPRLDFIEPSTSAYFYLFIYLSSAVRLYYLQLVPSRRNVCFFLLRRTSIIWSREAANHSSKRRQGTFQTYLYGS